MFADAINRHFNSGMAKLQIGRLSIPNVIVLALLAFAALNSALAQMKLLSPNTGWLINGNKLLWTRDNGANWLDITPHLNSISQPGTVGPVFFRNTDEGWVVLSYRKEIPLGMPQVSGDAENVTYLMHTADSGATWDSNRLIYPMLPEWVSSTISGPVSLSLVDANNGFMDIGLAGLLRPGKLLQTKDGGQTWTWTNSPGTSGPIFFVSLKDGWLISNDGAAEMYETHDGALTWAPVKLSTPKELLAVQDLRFNELPVFHDTHSGHLVVQYGTGAVNTLVVYGTHSSGRSWVPVQTVKISDHPAYAVTDSLLILPSKAKNDALSTVQIPLAASTNEIHETDAKILSLSFVDDQTGWARGSRGNLYATSDGGSNWKDISPQNAQGRNTSVLSSPTSTNTPSFLVASAGTPTSTAHLK